MVPINSRRNWHFFRLGKRPRWFSTVRMHGASGCHASCSRPLGNSTFWRFIQGMAEIALRAFPTMTFCIVGARLLLDCPRIILVFLWHSYPPTTVLSGRFFLSVTAFRPGIVLVFTWHLYPSTVLSDSLSLLSISYVMAEGRFPASLVLTSTMVFRTRT